MILCDIGNTTVDIYDNGEVQKLSLEYFKPEVFEDTVWYASVNNSVSKILETLPNWHTISTLIEWEKYYPTMGIDRILVCESVENGVIVDAGSAITVDVMKQGVYEGGFIALGLTIARKAYGELSSALDMSFNFEVELDKMAKNTPDAITIGFVAPLVEKIQRLGNPLYLCGGDAEFLSRYLPNAVADKELIFKGMKKLINKGARC